MKNIFLIILKNIKYIKDCIKNEEESVIEKILIK